MSVEKNINIVYENIDSTIPNFTKYSIFCILKKKKR